MLRRFRRQRTPFRGRSRRMGSRSSHASTSPRRTGRSSASTSSRSGTSRSTDLDSAPTWRSRAWWRRWPRTAPSSSSATGRSRGASRTSTTRSTRRSTPWNGGARARRSTSAAARRCPCSRPSRRSARSRDDASRSLGRHVARETRLALRLTRLGFGARSAGSRGSRSRKDSPLNGAGPLIGSRPHERRPYGFGAGGRAGSRSLVRLAAPEGEVVASDRRPPRGCRDRDRARSVRRLGVARADDRLPRPAVRSARQLGGITPLMEIAVRGSGPARVEQGADELAEHVVERVSLYVTEKTALLKQQVVTSEAQLAAVNVRIESAQEQQTAVLADQSLPLDQRLLITANLNSVITTADARRAAIQDDLFEARQLLNLAESVESSRVVEPAAASKTTARSSRTSLPVGALIGLLVGAVAALAWEPIAARRRGAAAASS